MADVKQTAGPNETANNLENERVNSIRNAFGSGKEEKNQENTENSQEKLDNKEKNSYIKEEENTEESSNSEETKENEDKPESNSEEDKFEKILNKQFDGDGKKAVKSWRDSQKEYTKLRQKAKEDKQIVQQIDGIIQKNPVLGKLMKQARQKGELSQEDLQNFLQSDREPQGKPNTSSNESKLEIVDDGLDIDNIGEETLAQEGLLDLSKKQLMSDSEWDLSRRQAAIKYAQKQLPNKIAENAVKRFEQQIEDKKEQERISTQKQKNKQINNERYQNGMDKVIDEFGLDFAGNEEHREALDEIEKRASYIRDPENPNVIRPNAIYLATLEMMDEGKIDVDKAENVSQKAEQARQQAEEDLEDKMGFNSSASSSKPTDSNPNSLADRLKQKRQKEYESEIEKRRKTDRLHTKST